MNVSTYVFGCFYKGYTQYPNDCTSQIFKTFGSPVDDSTLMAIHRSGNLMYYAYMRKLDKAGQYIGLCAVMNGLMIVKIDELFAMFEIVVANMIRRGSFIQFDTQGNIVANVGQLRLVNSVKLLAKQLQAQFDKLPNAALPPENFGIANNTEKRFTFGDNESEIIKAAHSFAYTYISKASYHDPYQFDNLKKVLEKVNEEKKQLQEQCDTLSAQLRNAKNAQRNIMWVGLLSVVVVILGVILWNKVLFPSEVTHYEMPEFTYYGPLNRNKMPEGIGVAIYPDSDKDQRKYYVGKFINGKRQDDEAMLLYKNGSFFYGSMTDDKWNKGVYYSTEDKFSYIGTFNDNKAYNGTFYTHKKAYDVVSGEEN